MLRVAPPVADTLRVESDVGIGVIHHRFGADAQFPRREPPPGAARAGSASMHLQLAEARPYVLLQLAFGLGIIYQHPFALGGEDEHATGRDCAGAAFDHRLG